MQPSLSRRSQAKNKYIDLVTASEGELLQSRICDFPLQIEGTWLEGCLKKLHQELEAKGISFKPRGYLADEWLTPQHQTVIGIPFYLAHPRLTELEKKMMLEAEGETPEWCMRLLRHEAGHAICYAYELDKKKKWRKLFGCPEREYPQTYRFRPYSKSYVQHLENYYAQYHPDEDFVETFAVWLTPQTDWRRRYAGWKALKKLEYVEQLLSQVKGKPPVNDSAQQFWRLSTLRLTLQSFYRRKRRLWAEEFPEFHDESLKRMFVSSDALGPEAPLLITRWQAVVGIIEKHRLQLIHEVSRSTVERKYLVGELLDKISQRCAELKLVTPDSPAQTVLKLTAYVTTLVMHYQYTGRFRGKKWQNTKRH